MWLFFETPEYTGNADGLGTLSVFWCLFVRFGRKTSHYQASTLNCTVKRQEVHNRNRSFHPRSPYAVAKTRSG
jgi:GDPmannose 4,6-dehydratase